jgi:S1-C subfamily serine protease
LRHVLHSVLTFALLALTLLGAMTASPARAEPADIAAAARSAVRVVLISESDGQLSLVGHGSGVAIAPDLILTNAHVVEAADEYDAVRVGIVPSQGKSGWFARIIAISPQNDLALLKLTEAGSLPTATLFTGAVDDGEDVFAIGYPGGVDLAQGLNVGDMVMPTAPVKTRGNVSAGRSSKQFETILHTASIGAGNSGGPLLDACGRVIGVNSFGTLANGNDSEFFFAVSIREINRFLLNAKVRPPTTGVPCRSLADLGRAEAERLAGEREQSDDVAQAAAHKEEIARRQAQFEVIAERENGMALAGIALVLALTAGGAAFFLAQKQRGNASKAAIGLGVLLLGAAVFAWIARPSLADIDTRAEALTSGGATGTAATSADSGASGNLVCVLDPKRSRVTVSDMADVPLRWSRGGCVNGDTQYGRTAEGWTRLLLPDREDTATLSTFDPATATYRADRYFLGIDDMARLRAERDKLKTPSCGASEDVIRTFGADQGTLASTLPTAANERLVYSCGKSGAQ